MSKILLVEDDNNLREIYEARLQAEGYEIVSAHDGEEALVIAKEEKPDLIISDVMMPKISGFEMLDILRNTANFKDIKVIMLTALGQTEDQHRASQLGADKYLVKSQVTLEDIVKYTQELLDPNYPRSTNLSTNSQEQESEPNTSSEISSTTNLEDSSAPIGGETPQPPQTLPPSYPMSDNQNTAPEPLLSTNQTSNSNATNIQNNTSVENQNIETTIDQNNNTSIQNHPTSFNNSANDSSSDYSNTNPPTNDNSPQAVAPSIISPNISSPIDEPPHVLDELDLPSLNNIPPIANEPAPLASAPQIDTNNEVQKTEATEAQTEDQEKENIKAQIESFINNNSATNASVQESTSQTDTPLTTTEPEPNTSNTDQTNNATISTPNQPNNENQQFQSPPTEAPVSTSEPTTTPTLSNNNLSNTADQTNTELMNNAVNQLIANTTPGQQTSDTSTPEQGSLLNTPSSDNDLTQSNSNNSTTNSVGGRKIISPLNESPKPNLQELLAKEEAINQVENNVNSPSETPSTPPIISPQPVTNIPFIPPSEEPFDPNSVSL